MSWPVFPFGFVGGSVQTNYPTTMEVFLVGGGGNGGSRGGGGGAGVLGWVAFNPLIAITNPPSTTTFTVTVGGVGAASQFSGPNITTRTANGGSTGANAGGASGMGFGGGASGSAAVTGAISGGGGGGYAAAGTAGTSAFSFGGTCPNFANSIYCGNGAEGYALPANLQNLLGVSTVGSGGAGGIPGNVQVFSGTCTVFIGTGSISLQRRFTTGVFAGTAGTGAGASQSNATMYGGGGGGGGGAGRGGVVVVRYPGNVTVGIGSGTGGSKSYNASEDRTYHVFTSSGQLSF